MMAFEQIERDMIADPAVRKAVAGLVRASMWGNAYLITTPLVYPSGTAVGVKVTPAQGGYWVSDFAMGFREAEGLEAQRSFGAHAGRLKDELGVEYTDGHEIRVFAREQQIASAIRKVSFAAHRIMTKVSHSLPEWDEQEITAVLYQRLRDLFGEAQVKGGDIPVSVLGASNIDWKFAAEVYYGSRRVLFDVVTPHHSSVFSAVSKFSDVRRRGPDSRPVAVVHDLNKMGKWLPLIAQEAEVIEDDASDDALRSVVAEAA
jgi:hypothetical protein